MNLEELGQELARVRAHVVREGEGYRRVQPSRDQRARTTTWARKDIKNEWQKDSKMEILMTYPFDILLLSVSYPFAIPPFCYPFTIHLPSVLGFHLWECKIFINYEKQKVKLGTGCSLNIVFFSGYFEIFWPFYVFPRCQCVYTHQVGRTPALQQNWQSSENHNILRKKHNI